MTSPFTKQFETYLHLGTLIEVQNKPSVTINGRTDTTVVVHSPHLSIMFGELVWATTHIVNIDAAHMFVPSVSCSPGSHPCYSSRHSFHCKNLWWALHAFDLATLSGTHWSPFSVSFCLSFHPCLTHLVQTYCSTVPSQMQHRTTCSEHVSGLPCPSLFLFFPSQKTVHIHRISYGSVIVAWLPATPCNSCPGFPAQPRRSVPSPPRLCLASFRAPQTSCVLLHHTHSPQKTRC